MEYDAVHVLHMKMRERSIPGRRSMCDFEFRGAQASITGSPSLRNLQLSVACFSAVATGFAANMSVTAKHATDRIASFLPTATVAAYQLILSSYPLKDGCSVGQSVLLWITLWVLALVTAGMALVQHRNETDEKASVWDHLTTGGSAKVYPWARAFFSAVAFFFVSFLTPPAPQCLIPQTNIPSGAAWIVAVLLGSIMTLGALVFPTNVSELKAVGTDVEAGAGSAARDTNGTNTGDPDVPAGQGQLPATEVAEETTSETPLLPASHLESDTTHDGLAGDGVQGSSSKTEHATA